MRVVLTAAVALFLTTGPVAAAPIVYTFESAPFTLGTLTPLTNVAPDAGDPAFAATFTAVPTMNGFVVSVIPLNSLMTGQTLQDLAFPAHGLVVLMNMAVDSVAVDFAVFAPGELRITTITSGTGSQASSEVGGPFQGGSLQFGSAIPFTSFLLTGHDSAGALTLFAVDNLRLNTVPEPISLVLLGVGFTALAARCRRSSRT